MACACLLALALGQVAWADIAPPEQPPGSSLEPAGQTQVRMLAERVVITVRSIPSDMESAYAGHAVAADVRADFDMRNLGAADEQIQVRFPLDNLSGYGDGFSRYPKVQDFAVSVDDQPIATTVITTPNPQGGDTPPIEWAAFDMTFPAAQDRHVGVTYTIAPTGYFPAARFSYILETGAGWRESIGSVDIIVQLPYDASVENVLPELEGIFQSWTTPNGWFFGNEIRWHWDNLEPSARDNFSVTVLAPSVWQAILDARRERSQPYRCHRASRTGACL